MTTKLDEMRAYVDARTEEEHAQCNQSGPFTARYVHRAHAARDMLTLALAAIDEARAEERARCGSAEEELRHLRGWILDRFDGADVGTPIDTLKRHLERVASDTEAAEQRAAKGAGDTALLATYGRTLQAIADAERAQSYALMTPRDEAYEPLKERALALARGGR